jgi:hypothetical protein
MNHIEILKRSLHTAWRYKALWFFGFFLALTTVYWESTMLTGGGNDSQSPELQYELSERERQWLSENLELHFKEDFTITGSEFVDFIQNEIVQMVVLIVILVVTFIVLMMIIGAVIHYLSETALIKMVNDYEKTDSKYTIRQGLRMAWSRTAWRLFLIDVAIRLPAALLFLVLFALTIAPIFGLAVTGTPGAIAGAVAAGGLFLLVLALAIVAGVFLSVLSRLSRQASAIDNLSVLDSIRRGYAVARHNLKDVGLMWLIMLGIYLIWPLLMFPLVILLLGIGILIGGLLAVLIGAVGSLVTAGAGAWIAAGVVGGILFLLVMIVPLVLLTGMREVFQISAWTLTYRELRNVQNVKVKDQPKPATI